MKNQFIMALNQVCTERNLSQEVVLETIEVALVSAYKRKFGSQSNIVARIDLETGKSFIYKEKLTVNEIEDERYQIMLPDARQYDPEVELGETVLIDSTPQDFGRIAAQTAKQVLLQRIREAERDALFDSYADREGELIHSTVQRVSPQGVILNLGRTEASLPYNQQIPGERYRVNQRLRAYVLEVRKANRGPQIIVSRSHRNMLRRLLELEVPEVFNGIVEVKAIAREAGARSKVAVAATQAGVDPVGSCVGMRGIRIQNIVNELSGEKVDIVAWDADTAIFIANSLSPARVSNVLLDEEPGAGKTATVVVPDDQLSLAIGKEGQNARLAAKLTNWRIDIKSISEAADEVLRREKERDLREAASSKDLLAMAEAILMGKDPAEFSDPVALEELRLGNRILNALKGNDILNIQQLVRLLEDKEDDLLALDGIGPKSAQEIKEKLAEANIWPRPVEQEIADEISAEEPAKEVISETVAEQVVEELVPPQIEDVKDADLVPVTELDKEPIIEAEVEIKIEREDDAEIEIGEEESIAKETIDELEVGAEEASIEVPADFPLSIVGLEEEEEIEESNEKLPSRKKKKRRKKQLVYDENAGRVVSRRKRKPGRQRKEWEDIT